MKPFYITTPIYYVNGEPHVGHVYTTLLADVFTRFHKLKDEEVFLLTGSDCHGQKVADTAAAKGVNIDTFRNGVIEDFQRIFDKFNLKYDRYIRTTDDDHVEAVRAIFKRIYDKGYIYKGSYEGWYSVREEMFCTEKQVEDCTDEKGNSIKISIESGAPVEWKSEENYMFKLSEFQKPLLDYYRDHPDSILPAFRQQEIVKFIEGGLNDLSVSRKNPEWGISVPELPGHSIYVWMDALTNYLTGAGFPSDASRWPADIHLIGKDILKFHAIYWPAFLLAADIPIYDKILAHGWWTKDHKKISKSLGNAFDLDETLEKYGIDAVRYFLLRESNLSSDGDFSDASMQSRLNSDLADEFGNLFSRCMAKKLNPDNIVPPIVGDLLDSDKQLIDAVSKLPAAVDQIISVDFDLQRAVIRIFETLSVFNKYVTAVEPWKLKGTDELVQRRGTVLHIMLESMRIIATLLLPFMPEKIEYVLKCLGVDKSLWNLKSLGFDQSEYKTGSPLGDQETVAILFPKYEEGGPKWAKKGDAFVKNPKTGNKSGKKGRGQPSPPGEGKKKNKKKGKEKKEGEKKEGEKKEGEKKEDVETPSK